MAHRGQLRLSWLVWCSLIAAIGCNKRASDQLARLTVMTYNVNFGIPGDDEAIKAIRDGGADIVLLQETTKVWERRIRIELSGTYPHMEFRDCCGAGGLAILSKQSIYHSDYLDRRDDIGGWFPAWRHVVKTPLGPVQILNVHLRPPLDDNGSFVLGALSTGTVRRGEMVAFLSSIKQDMPTIVAGDFNENRHGPALRYLADAGFGNALAEMHIDDHTWRWNTALGTARAQIDHIAHDSCFVPVRAAVLPQGKSDHRPVVASFAPAPPSRRGACSSN